jgi:hypothetical protein
MAETLLFFAVESERHSCKDVGMKPLQGLAFVLYLPLLSALGHRMVTAPRLHGALYAAVLAVMARRAFLIGKNRLEAGLPDVIVAGLGDALLAFLLLKS